MSVARAQVLTSSEAVLWMIERDPVLRSTIVAVAVLDGPPDMDRLRRRMAHAVEAFPRLGRRIEPGGAGVPHWVPIPDLCLDHHVTSVRLPAPGSLRQLLDLAGEQAGEAFDVARPLWHLTVVEGLDGGRAALIVKVHHTVTDGVGGVGLLPIFTDLEACPAEEPGMTPSSPPVPRQGRRRRNRLLSAAGSMLGEATSDPVGALTLGPRFARSTAKLLAPATHARQRRDDRARARPPPRHPRCVVAGTGTSR